MSTTSEAINPSAPASAATTVRNISQATLLYWSIRREIWENKSVYIAPIAAAVVFFVGYLLAVAHGGIKMFDVSGMDVDPSKSEVITGALNTCAGIIMAVTFIVGFFYSLDSLYSERRDRSILFWKSLPVSDLVTILSKVAIPLLVLPAIAFATIVVTQFVVMLLGSAVLAVHGVSPAELWSAASVFYTWAVLLYMAIVLILWYAPIVGWLMLISAWAQRLAILWAVLVPIGFGVIEAVGLSSYYIFKLGFGRIGGVFKIAFDSADAPASFGAGDSSNVHVFRGPLHAAFGLSPDPVQLISSPQLWIGLVVGVALLAGALRLRRSREAL